MWIKKVLKRILKKYTVKLTRKSTAVFATKSLRHSADDLGSLGLLDTRGVLLFQAIVNGQGVFIHIQLGYLSPFKRDEMNSFVQIGVSVF
jgi:hypothetical protein